MGALLTVHETIAIDTQKQCSLLYRALLYFEENKKVVPCCLGCLFKKQMVLFKTTQTTRDNLSNYRATIT